MILDDPVEVNVKEILPRRGAPVAEQARLDVLQLQWLLQERVVHEVDLADGQVVGRPPVSVQLSQFLGGQRAGRRGRGAVLASSFHCGTCGCHCSHS